MTDWHPMETAPIWREVLLFYPEHAAGIRIGSRLTLDAPWSVGMDMNGAAPTHWASLPAPPAGAAYWPPLSPPADVVAFNAARTKDGTTRSPAPNPGKTQ